MQPAIISDIDGVLYSGGVLKGNSPSVFKDIIHRKLPFVLCTNGGMMTES